MKLDRAFKKLRSLRNDLPCRLTPTETVKVLVELLDEQIGKLQACLTGNIFRAIGRT